MRCLPLLCCLYVGAGAVAHSAQPADEAPSLQQLVEQLATGDEFRRREASAALFERGAEAKPVVPRLAMLAESDEQEVRWAALAALTGTGPAAAEAVPAMIRLLSHDDFHTQYWACRVLAAIGLPAAEPAVDGLIAALREEAASVRRNAAIALGALGPKVAARTRQPLLQALEDRQASVRTQAAVALGQLGPAAKDAADRLGEMMRDPNPETRIVAAVSRWQVGGPMEPTLELLLSEMQQQDAPLLAAEGFATLGPAAAPAVPRLIEMLQSDSSERRLVAALALGEIGAPAAPALPTLDNMQQQDPDQDLRTLAGEVAMQIRQAAETR